MSLFSKATRRIVRDIADSQAKAAYIAMTEELFQDYYRHRWQVYRMNLVRGIFLGFGTVIGGTLVVALLIWILSFFTHVPIIGNFFQDTTQTIQQHQDK